MPSNDLQRLQTSVELVLAHARKLGASQTEAGAGKASGLSVTARMRDVETLEYHRDQSLGVPVYFGYRKGSASTSDMSDGAIEETVSKACSLAQFAAEDPYSGLADPEFLATDILDLSLCHPWGLEAPKAIELALACEAAALNQDKRLSNSEGATVSTQTGAHFYGNSHGFMAGYLDSEHSISCAVLAIDGSGMNRVLVENGVLRGYVLASYYARKLAMVTTGNAGGIHNLQVSNTGESFNDLLKAMDRGFLVSEMMGQGINIVTGDYSRGAAGFWVENGEIQYPVHEITIAGNLRDMYRGIVAIGIDTDYRGGIRTGSILIDKMTIAGN